MTNEKEWWSKYIQAETPFQIMDQRAKPEERSVVILKKDLPALILEAQRRDREQIRKLIEKSKIKRTKEQELKDERYGQGQTYNQGVFHGQNWIIEYILSHLKDE